jgi:hypothetical protein
VIHHLWTLRNKKNEDEEKTGEDRRQWGKPRHVIKIDQNR